MKKILISILVTAWVSAQVCDQSDEQCKNCIAPHVWYNDACETCTIDSCAQCDQSNPQICGECNTGFQLSQNKTTCSQSPKNCTMENCKSCNETSCLECQEYYSLDEQDGKCQLICQVQNCQQCQQGSNSTCQTCIQNYEANSEGNCIESCNVQNCSICADGGQQCEECLDNYVLVNGSCPICEVQECTKCKKGLPKQCETCNSGFQILESGDCGAICPHSFYPDQTQCKPCLEKCDQCQNSQTCSSCYQGHFFEQGQCKKCCSHCSVCLTDDECSECEYGYTLNSHKHCQPLPWGIQGEVAINEVIYECQSGCTVCTQTGQCSSCGNGFFISGNKCLQCSSNCMKCESENICSDCYMGFGLNDEGECFACSTPNCLRCNNQDVCSLCPKGYQLLSNSTCKACNDECQICKDDICFHCTNGHIPWGSQCVECLSSCSVCSKTNISQCLSCREGYYMNSKNRCQKCPQYCSRCSDSECISCEIGYEEIDGSCQLLCQFPCLKCQTNKPDICLDCYGGYELVDKACIQKENLENTALCPRQYYSKDQQCIKCSTSSPCLDCDFINEEQKCTRCDNGFYLASNTCASCPENCQNCLSESFCISCASGFYVPDVIGQRTGKCEQCSGHHFCKTCYNSPSQCTSCQQDYFLIGFKCIAQDVIYIKLHLTMDFVDFVKKANDVKKELMKLVGRFNPVLEGKIEYLTLSQAKEGSTRLSYSLSIPKGLNNHGLYENLKHSLKDEDNLPFQQSSPAQVSLTENEDHDEDREKKIDKEKKYAMVIVALVIIGIILLMIIYTACSKKKRPNQQNRSDRESNKEQGGPGTDYELNSEHFDDQQKL